jgi:hypothetical protein
MEGVYPRPGDHLRPVSADVGVVSLSGWRKADG